MVWRAVQELLQKPELIRAEIDRRVEIARESAPIKRRETVLRKDRARVEKQIVRLLDAYQEALLPLEELRRRMVKLLQRQLAIQSELRTLGAADAYEQMCLRIAETTEGFLSRVRAAAGTMNAQDRLKILRLLVKEILVDDDAITIRHSIPVQDPGSPPTSPGGPKIPGCLLRSGSPLTAACQHRTLRSRRGLRSGIGIARTGMDTCEFPSGRRVSGGVGSIGDVSGGASVLGARNGAAQTIAESAGQIKERG